MRLRFVIVCVSALLSLAASAQAPPASDPAVTAADKAYTAQNWTEAEPQYSALTKQQPDNARFWYRLGTAARGNKHYDVALEAFQKAKTLGVGKGLPVWLSDYEIATTYAGKGDPAQALENLKTAANAGFLRPSRLENDSEWNAVRSNERFIALAKQAQHNANPCGDAEFKQFDFWVGDWDVASAADGVQRGSSHISKEMNGCVVWENWTSAGSPYFGKSYNTWNPNLKRWEQYWVDTGAGVMFFHGNLKDNVMDYWTDDVPQANGGTLLRHLQFFNLGADKVRQFSQGSTDGGKAWHTEYDFIYTRVAAKPAPSAGSN
jgi:tetratricopeptide (TPR) repeat protein